MTREIPILVEILARLVDAGVPLKDVAMFAGIPAAPRKLHSDAAGMVQTVFEVLEADKMRRTSRP
jgi:hypothetical protein